MITSYEEALMWNAVLNQAKKGNEDAQKQVEAENRLRQKAGQPTVEQELMDLMQKAGKNE